MNKQPLISICIPTFKREDILRITLDSIYADLEGIDLSDFEVVVSDNDPEQACKGVVEELCRENLFYYPTRCEGFLNSFYVLSYGKGEFLKLHNNQITLKSGALRIMIESVKEYRRDHTMFIFTNGNLLSNKVKRCEGFDSFINELSYFCSWSSGYGMWKEDYDKVKDCIKVDKYFPQTSLLLSQYYNQDFAVDDRPLYGGQKVQKKGGYNTYEVFGVCLLDLLNQSLSEQHISVKTFQKVKKELLFDYLAPCYFKTVIIKYDNFDHTNIKKHLSKYYSLNDYCLMILVSFFTPLRQLVKKISKVLRR